MLQLKGIRPLSALVLALAAACGGGGDDGTTPPPPPPTPSIALTLSASATTLQAGGNTTFTATIARTNFTGAVSVAVSGAPAGVTSNVTNSGDTYTVAITTVATAAAGNYPLTVTASGSGVSNATGTYTLTLTAPPAASYTLSVAPTTLSVAQGATGQATVNLARVNFTGAVGLAVTGAPAGVTTTLGASSVTGDNTTLAVAIGSAVAAGNYTLTVTGTVAGQTDRTATLALTVTAAASGSIALSANPATLSATPGGAAVTSTITIARTNFAGAVTLAVTGTPAGVTTAIATSPTTGNTATLTVTASAGAAAGNSTLTITGSGTGITNATTQIALTVSAAAGTISITAGNNTIQQGSSGSLNVFVTRANFTGAVTLAATGQPTGVTTTFTQPGTGNSGQVTFTVGAATPAGSYPIVVTASGTGVANATATGTLTVTATSSGGGNVTFNFCGGASDLPIWLAAQNGNGAWTQVTAGANNSYSFNISTTGGVAYVTQNAANDYDLTLIYGNRAELDGRGINACTTVNPTPRSVTGTVSGFGLTNSDQVSVSFGGAVPTTAPTAAAPNFTINNVPAGVRDLLGSRSGINLANPLAGFTPNKIFIKRGLNPANGGSVGTVDFNGTDAFDPDSKTVTLGGLTAGEQTTAVATFNTANGGGLLLGFGLPGTSSTLTYSAVPSSRTVAGDLHALAASAITSVNNIPTAIRLVTTIFRDATNTTLNMGAVLSTPTISSTNGAYARLRAVLARQTDYQNLWLAGFTQASGGSTRSVSITMTEGYIGNAANFDAAIPDFSGVGGWQNVWGPLAGAATQWQVSANGFVIGSGQQAEGTQTRTASRFGTFTP